MDWKAKLSAKFEDELEDLYKFNAPDGWQTIIESLLEYVHWHNQVHQTAVKIYSIEKRGGGLHFVVHHYPNGPTSSVGEEVFGAIHLAESISCKTCEVCGKPGIFRKQKKDDGLLLGTFCDEHFQ